MTKPFLLVAACLSVAATACAHDGGSTDAAMQTCKRSLSKEFEIVNRESITDDDMNYKEHEGLKFGLIKGTQAFVQYADDSPVPLEAIQFLDVENHGVRLKSEALAIERSDLYVRSEKGQTTFCLLTPFSGLGSSGSFQNFAALTAIGVQDGKASKPVGEVIRRR